MHVHVHLIQMLTPDHLIREIPHIRHSQCLTHPDHSGKTFAALTNYTALSMAQITIFHNAG